MKSHIEPIDFVNEMNRHWTEDLNLVSSDNLKRNWMLTGEYFKAQMTGQPIDKEDDEATRLYILTPETGTGKTVGCCVYAAMNAQLPEASGMLIVTKRIEDAKHERGLAN
jgi:hypothetical protein